jgi:hypothetical protein
MPEIDAEIAAYSAMQRELEEKYMGKWILFYHGQLIAVYKSFDDAAKDAVARFGRSIFDSAGRSAGGHFTRIGNVVSGPCLAPDADLLMWLVVPLARIS